MDLAWVITTAFTIMIGAISYFLKRTINQVDKHEEQLKETVSRDEMKDATARIEEDIRTIKKEYLTKDDFIREMSSVTNKLDRIYDILLEQAKKG